ncbi:MAG: NAD-dependent epimerase/dehydratase family protein [Candidatus Obscuribacterales bacterium]|nr:NAD-dependent epimerase/dehydratase family protein [Candidatus Obscuribacterales bacterium]
MKLLIIGGTVFLGRQIVKAALEAGHQVSTFNRGNHILEEQASVERLIGDRNIDLSILSTKKWDAVIDCCGMEAQQLEISCRALKNSVSTYAYISSVSAYDNFRNIGMTEHAALKLTPEELEQDYGSGKAHSEETLLKQFPKNSLIIRPGLLVGPFDPTDRFTYWPHRIKEGGRVLAPGRAERPVQFIDVRDLAEWIIRLLEADLLGIYHVTGPG